jgi:hypothetical protein
MGTIPALGVSPAEQSGATVPAASVRRRLARKTGNTIAEQCGKDVQLFHRDQ